MTSPSQPTQEMSARAPDIVGRLRHLAKLLGVGSFDIPSNLNEAAEEIAALLARNAELETKVVSLERWQSARLETTDFDIKRIVELEKALGFYADGTRYNGANQRRVEGDPFTTADAAYRKDVTRDGGSIARAALKSGGGA